VRLTETMKNLIVKIMAEILGILAIATKEVKQCWGSKSDHRQRCHLTDNSEKYLKKLLGRTDIEDALKRMDKLSNDQALTATVQVLGATYGIDNKMEQVVDGVQRVVFIINHNDQPLCNATNREQSR
jgi:hypothetical protein